MSKRKAVINFKQYKDNDLVEIAQLIVSKMSLNADFPKPVPTLTVIQTAITEYSAALVKAKDGTKQDTQIKNDKKLVLEDLLAKLGNYVNGITEGDLAKLDGSGFPITKLPEPIGILPVPENFHVTTGDNSGEALLNFSSVPKATGYIGLFATVPAPENNEEWYSKLFSNSRGCSITGLKSGTKYIFKLAAASSEANKMSKYNFTPPVEKIIP